jgi:hypothetical protein
MGKTVRKQSKKDKRQQKLRRQARQKRRVAEPTKLG